MLMITENDIDKILFDNLLALKSKIIANHVAAGQRASGRTIESLRVEVAKGYGVLYGRGYFGTLETGRKPGAVPKGFKEIIQKWMDDKGIDGSAYLIARKIAREGTKLYREGGRGDIYSNVIPMAIKDVRSDLGELFKLTIKSIKLNQL